MGNERRYSLDVLRIIATILIIFHHYGQVTGLYLEGHINYWNGRFYFGYVVEFFFLLSGYFMYRYIGKITNGLTFKKFFLPRALRLLPLVFISGITYEVLLGIYQKVCGGDWFGVSITVWGVIINALGVQDGWVFTNPMVNNPTWYISVLLLCYIVFYLLTYLGKRWQIPHIYLFVFMVLLGCGAQTYGLNLPFLNGSSCRGYYAFFFGVQDGWVFTNPMVNNPTWYISVLLLCYIVFYLLTYLGKRWQIPHIYLFVFMVLLGCGAQTYGLNLPFLNGSSCRGYYAFFFGVLLAEWLEKLNAAKKSQNIYVFLGSIMSVAFLLCMMVYKWEWVAGGINYLMTFWFYPALIIIFSSGPVAKLFDHKFIGTLGKITYDTYI